MSPHSVRNVSPGRVESRMAFRREYVDLFELDEIERVIALLPSALRVDDGGPMSVQPNHLGEVASVVRYCQEHGLSVAYDHADGDVDVVVDTGRVQLMGG